MSRQRLNRSLDRIALRVLKACLPYLEIYGRDVNENLYLTRFMLSPDTRFGRVYLHRFSREDNDRDPHDHPFNFFTLPLNQGYREEVYEHGVKCVRVIHAPRLRWSFRPALHTHRVTETDSGAWPLWTLVLRGPNVRKWGFWVFNDQDAPGFHVPKQRSWIHWKRYVNSTEDYGPEHRDAHCPGVPELLDSLDRRRSIATKPRPGFIP